MSRWPPRISLATKFRPWYRAGASSAFFRRQVHVARGQGQAVFGAEGFGADDFGRHRELARHVTHDHQLLIILLAEHGHARLHAGEQLGHDRAHAAEEAGAEFAFQRIAERVGRLDAVFLRLRVQVLLGRREQHVDAFLFQLVDVGLEGARILVEVFVRAELQAVHENGGDDRVAMLARQAHQRQVAFVQVAHRRNKSGAQLAAQSGRAVLQWW